MRAPYMQALDKAAATTDADEQAAKKRKQETAVATEEHDGTHHEAYVFCSFL